MIIPKLPTNPPQPNIEASSVYPGYLMPIGAKYQYKPLGFLDTAAWGVTGFVLRGAAGWYLGKQLSKDKKAPVVGAVSTAFLGLLGPIATAVFFGMKRGK